MRWLLAWIFASLLVTQTASPGRNAFTLRGQRQDVYLVPSPVSGKPAGRVIYLPGDGGWRGFAIETAQTIAGWGYDVFGIDTKRYLESFTTSTTTLKETDVIADFREFAAWVRRGTKEPVHLVGWSEGAGLGLLGVATLESRSLFTGLVALGLPETPILGWRAADNLTWITRRLPNEPTFRSIDYVGRAATPLVLIHASGDEYTSVDTARKLFAAAGEPKRFALVRARNHRYEGGRDEFFRVLREGLEWLSKTAR